MAENDNTKGWKDILSVLDSPLKLFGLVLLIANGLLVLFASRTGNQDSKLLFILCFVGFFVLVVVFFVLFLRQGRIIEIPKIGQTESNKKTYKYDFFVAAPMAAINTNEEYQNERSKIIEVIKTIKEVSGFQTCYYAGENIDSFDKFQTEDISVKQDMEGISNSKYFILVYTGKYLKPSSVVFEAGVALALGKKSIYFGQEGNLPFLMKQADKVFSHVKIYKADSPGDVINILKNNGKALFEIG
jgi:hypothetical protein